MVYLAIAWIISLGLAFIAGYKWRDVTERLTVLEESVKAKIDKKPEPAEPQSSFINPDDPVQQAQWEHEQTMKKLNDG